MAVACAERYFKKPDLTGWRMHAQRLEDVKQEMQ